MTAPALHPSTDTAPDWSVWSRKATGGRGPELPLTAADVRLKYNDVSVGLLTMPFSPEAWVRIGRGTRVEVRRHRKTLVDGSVVDRELQIDADHPTGQITVAVESDEGLLADRRCFPDPALPFLSQTNGATYRLTAPGETLAKALVNLNAGPGALPERRVAGLTVEPDQGRGLTYLTILRYDPLLTTLQVIGRDWGPLGFRVVTTPAGREFRMFEPPDLSASVRFSLALGNLTGQTYRESAPTVTVAMAEGIVPEERNNAGAVTRSAQPLRYEETTTDPASIGYGRRAETWSDVGDRIVGVTDLHKPVRESLGDGAAATSLVLTPSSDAELNADPAAVLGARVTVQVGPLDYTGTIAVVDVVREVRCTYDLESGLDTVTPVVGSDGATADVLNFTPELGGINRRLGQLERR